MSSNEILAPDAIAPPGAPIAPPSLVERLCGAAAAQPLEALAAVVTAATAVFYWAERGVNEKVQDPWDAFHYVTTALSVGYANIFPVTPIGKAVGGLVMMVGPALSSHALDRPAAEPQAATALVAKLDEILVELRRLGAKEQP